MKIRLDSNAFLPARDWNTGTTLHLRLPMEVYFEPREFVTIDTGVHIEIPENAVGIITMEEYLTSIYGLSASTYEVDCENEGFIKVQVFNTSDKVVILNEGQNFVKFTIQLEMPETVSIESPKLDWLRPYSKEDNIGDCMSNEEFHNFINTNGCDACSTNVANCIQFMIPIDYVLDCKNRLKPVYPTFKCDDQKMRRYCGNCFKGHDSEPSRCKDLAKVRI